MVFAFICDARFQKKAFGVWVNGEIPNHEIVPLTADEFLTRGKLPEGISGVIVERVTWQKNFSMFRYFDLLPLLEKQCLAFIANAPAEFKGRAAMKNKEFIIPNGIGAEDASIQLTRLVELPPPAFTHPKSRAIA